jgi:hypothetical protein
VSASAPCPRAGEVSCPPSVAGGQVHECGHVRRMLGIKLEIYSGGDTIKPCPGGDG